MTYDFAALMADVASHGPNTHGWDATIAVRSDFLNSMLSLVSGPTIGAGLVGGTYTGAGGRQVYLGLTMTKPFLSFVEDVGQGQAQAYSALDPLYGGMLFVTDSNGAPQYSVHMAMTPPVLSGTCTMAALNTDISTAQNGRAYLDLSNGQWSTNSSGLTTGMGDLTGFEAAMTTNFLRENGRAPLGQVNGNIDGANALLVPKSFAVRFQKNPRDGTGAAVFFVESNGNKGGTGPLAVYPLSDDIQVAIDISSQTFADVIAQSVTGALSQFGVQMTTGGVASGADQRRKAYATQGSINFGKVSYDDHNVTRDDVDLTIQSADDDDNQADLVVSFTATNNNVQALNLSFIPNMQALSVQWRPYFVQDFREYWWLPEDDGEFRCNIFIEYTMEAPITIDGSTIKITSTFGTGTATVSNLQTIVSGVWNPDEGDMNAAINDFLVGPMQHRLQDTLDNMPFQGVAPFATACLLFDEEGGPLLQQVGAPTDLLVGANTAAALAVTPASTQLNAGEAIQLTVTSLSNVRFQDLAATPSVILNRSPRPPRGTASVSGNVITYTADATAPTGTLIKLSVTATDADTQKTILGFAEITINNTDAKAQPPMVVPQQASVASGSSMPIDVVDGSGALIPGLKAGDFQLSDTLSGATITDSPDSSRGRFLLTVPTVTSAQSGTISLSSQPEAYEAAITIAPLAVNMALSGGDTVSQNEPLTLTLLQAGPSIKGTDAIWSAYTDDGPAGNFVPSGTDATCVYTAPALPDGKTSLTVTVVAAQNVTIMGLATKTITVTA